MFQTTTQLSISSLHRNQTLQLLKLSFYFEQRDLLRLVIILTAGCSGIDCSLSPSLSEEMSSMSPNRSMVLLWPSMPGEKHKVLISLRFFIWFLAITSTLSQDSETKSPQSQPWIFSLSLAPRSLTSIYGEGRWPVWLVEGKAAVIASFQHSSQWFLPLIVRPLQSPPTCVTVGSMWSIEYNLTFKARPRHCGFSTSFLSTAHCSGEGSCHDVKILKLLRRGSWGN